MTTTTKPQRPTLTLRSKRATQAREPGAAPEAHRPPETPREASGTAGAAPTPEREPDKAPKSFNVHGKLWERAVAAYSRGHEKPSSRRKTLKWLQSIVLGAIRNRERTRDQEHESVSIRAPVGSGDRFAAAAEEAGYDCVSEWACAVLDAAVGQADRNVTE